MKTISIVGENYFGKWDKTELQSYADTDEMRRDMYFREFTALTELLDIV